MKIQEQIKNYIINEIQKLELIKDDVFVELITTYNFDSIDNQKQKITSLNYKNEPLLYIIKTNSDVNIEDVSATKVKCKNDGFSMFKINDENFKEQQKNKIKYLYIGSSHNITKRLQEHLGTGGSPKTYALHLKKWFNKQIQIEIYRTKEEYLQLFEDILYLIRNYILKIKRCYLLKN